MVLPPWSHLLSSPISRVQHRLETEQILETWMKLLSYTYSIPSSYITFIIQALFFFTNISFFFFTLSQHYTRNGWGNRMYLFFNFFKKKYKDRNLLISRLVNWWGEGWKVFFFNYPYSITIFSPYLVKNFITFVIMLFLYCFLSCDLLFYEFFHP